LSEDSSIGHYADLNVMERSSQQSHDFSAYDDESEKDDEVPMGEIK